MRQLHVSQNPEEDTSYEHKNIVVIWDTEYRAEQVPTCPRCGEWMYHAVGPGPDKPPCISVVYKSASTVVEMHHGYVCKCNCFIWPCTDKRLHDKANRVHIEAPDEDEGGFQDESVANMD
jgi:hypothetical protein